MLDELAAGDGELSPTLRRRLAGAAFQRTARYDAAIANWFAEGEDEFPDTILLGFDKHLEVSYGENPHQRGAYYAERGARTHLLARDRAAPRQGALVQQPLRPGRRARRCWPSSSCRRA